MATSKLPPKVLEYFREQGAIGGKIGGRKAAESMTPEQRTERARRAALASNEARRARKAQRDGEKAADASRKASEPVAVHPRAKR